MLPAITTGVHNTHSQNRHALETRNSRDRVKQSKTDYIMLVFYRPKKTDPWLNRAVAWMDGPFSHVEIGFSDGYACSIFGGERIFMKKRTFSNTQYSMHSIAMSPAEVQGIRLFCSVVADAGIEFDEVGMYSVHFTRPLAKTIRGLQSVFGYVFHGNHGDRPKEHARLSKDDSQWNDSRFYVDPKLGSMVESMKQEGTFCSKLVTMALQYAGVEAFMHLNASQTSPSALYRIVCDEDFTSEVIAAAPYRRMLLEANPDAACKLALAKGLGGF